MSDTQFTLGPWRRGFKNIGHVTAENGAIVTKCQRLTSLCNLQANAHLIAAAPELYEALLEMVEAFGNGAHNIPEDTREPITNARTALAKARGEA